MKFSKLALLGFSGIVFASCSGQTATTTTPKGNCVASHFAAASPLPNLLSTQASPLPGISPTPSASPNVMLITVDGSLCGGKGTQYPNEPCASVTICSPANPTQCQTIGNLLLDTGSYGLRVFSSAITVPLTPVTAGNQNLAECVQYGDGTSQWGQIEYAYVQLGSEPAVNMPILVINSSYATPPDACTSSQSTPDTGPSAAGYNGILGVGLFAHDCGAACVTSLTNGQYFSCNEESCACGATVALAAQVQNPVALLPVDNNGVILELPAVSSTSGVASLSGSLLLGIGTQSNNTLTGLTTYPTDTSGNFLTTFSSYSSSAMPSFLDSGSNGLFFPAPTGGQLPDCGITYGSSYSGAYCPSSVKSFSAINAGASGTSSGTISFQIGNTHTLLTSQSAVFNDYGANALSAGQSAAASFDWGLPFFFGRNVVVGIEGTTSTLGTGPLWAY